MFDRQAALKQRQRFNPRSTSLTVAKSCIAMLLLSSMFIVETLAVDLTPEVRATVDKALGFLKATPLTKDEEAGLVVYTAIAAGEPINSTFIAKNVATILKKFPEGQGYKPSIHHNYEAGVDAMGLVAANREQYRDKIQTIATFLINEQKSHGAWDYAEGDHKGDTSISQYGALGLWAAARAGIPVPLKTWGNAVGWHLRTQGNDGGFGYQPDIGDKVPRHSMTAAGVGSLGIAKIFLFDPSAANLEPDEVDPEAAKPKKNGGKPFGVLERVTQTETPQATDSTKKDDSNYKVTVTRKEIEARMKGGIGWIAKNYSMPPGTNTGWPLYYLYSLERAATLANVDKINGHDWYKEGGAYLIKTQKADGSWFEPSGAVTATCFGILFLTRATEKIAPKAPPSVAKKAAKTLGEGMLQGGRGLPTDLANVDTKNGQIKAKVMDTPLDRLLADLENPKSQNVEATQAALVESIQVGNREALLGKKELLVKLAKDSRSEVRRTAFWALGRCNDLRVVPLLLKGLLDVDFDASVEARNALCMLSRKPRGFGLLDDALDKIPQTATPDERDAIVEKWRREDAARWKEWYQKVRPYDERDNLPD